MACCCWCWVEEDAWHLAGVLHVGVAAKGTQRCRDDRWVGAPAHDTERRDCILYAPGARGYGTKCSRILRSVICELVKCRFRMVLKHTTPLMALQCVFRLGVVRFLALSLGRVLGTPGGQVTSCDLQTQHIPAPQAAPVRPATANCNSSATT